MTTFHNFALAGELQGWLTPFWKLEMSTVYACICMVYLFSGKNKEKYKVKKVILNIHNL